MKKLRSQISYFVLLVMALGILVNSERARAEDFQFTFRYESQSWKHSVEAPSWDVALEKASQACFNHFTGARGQQRVRMDQASADSLLDTCTNPR